jgi:hypothetical protein
MQTEPKASHLEYFVQHLFFGVILIRPALLWHSNLPS